MRLSAEQLTLFLLGLSVILLSAKLLGSLMTKIKQPAIIGEIMAGILLGPTVFGIIAPTAFRSIFPQEGNLSIAYEGFVTVAVVLLLLVSGLEVNLSVVLSQGKSAIVTGLLGLILPFALGFGAAIYFPQLLGIGTSGTPYVFALFMGTALSISALPVIAKTLMDLKIFKSEIGSIIISAAMFNDLMGWLIFSVILGFISETHLGFNFLTTVLLMFLFVLILLTIGKKIINWFIPHLQKFGASGGVLSFIFILGLASAAFTEYIGIHAIFGAFIVGISIGDSSHLKEEIKENIHQFVSNLFAPLFFVSIGLKVNFLTNFDPIIVLIVLALSFAGKLIGCSLGAYWSGSNKTDSIVIGFGMNSRGAMEIILGLLALDAGLINERVFVALVIMALVTSLTSGPVMNYFLTLKGKTLLKNIISEKRVFVTNQLEKESLIEELAERAALELRVEKSIVVDSVLARERLLPTGISNYLAIPHAKIKIKEPFVSIALNASAIDFGAQDGLPSRIVFLLLTPESNNDLQLRLLAEISSKFKNKEEVEALIRNGTKQALVDFIST